VPAAKRECEIQKWQTLLISDSAESFGLEYKVPFKKKILC